MAIAVYLVWLVVTVRATCSMHRHYTHASVSPIDTLVWVGVLFCWVEL